jgi:hypothetical protein
MDFWQTKKPVWEEPGEGGSGAPDGGAAPESPTPEPGSAPDAAPDYSFLPEQYRSGEAPDIEGFRAHYDEMAARIAVMEESAGEVPEDAAGYELAVPDDLDFGDLALPEDFSVEIKSDDPVMAPLLGELGGFMHKHGLPKDAASEVMGLLAKYEASKFSESYQLANQQMEALGATAESRISNVERALQSRLPPNLVDGLKAATRTADGVKALEKLLSVRGPTAPTPQPPTTADDDGLSARYNS